ncbi:MAG: hypothetical protein WCR56_04360 [Bacilli bacterium]
MNSYIGTIFLNGGAKKKMLFCAASYEDALEQFRDYLGNFYGYWKTTLRKKRKGESIR